MSDVSKTSDLIAGLREHLNEMPISFNENVWQVRSKREVREAHDRATIEHQATRDKVRKLLDALATRVPVQGEPECECWPTEEKYHFVHFGATEPGSALEYNPECPEHGGPNDEPCLGCGGSDEDGHDDCTIKVRTFRATVPDAATRHACSDTEFHQYLVENLPEDEASRRELAAALRGAEGERDSYKQERDAALAAVKRVRARLQPTLGGTPTGEFAEVCGCGKDYFPCDHAAAIIAALDGAPEPEWEREYRRVRPDGVPVFNAVFETMPLLDDYYTAEYRTVSPWLPVEGEKP